MKIRALFPVFLAVLLLPSGTARHGDRAQDPNQAPKGLSGKDWSSIQAEYQRNQHAAVPEGGGYRARNNGQQWVTHFDGRGFTVQPNSGQWTWGLELERYGFAGQERTVTGRARATSEKDRVRYAWGTMEEWFVNDRRGLEHGFTLPRRPARAGYRGPLRMHLGVRGGLSPQVAQDGGGVSFVDASGRALVIYAGLKVWDASGKLLPARFEPASQGSGLSLAVEEVGAQYPLTIDPTAQQAYLKASNTGAGDLFGLSVAVSGETVVIGAIREDGSATGVGGTSNEGATDSGAAYVFVRNAGVWSQQAYLKASNTGAGDLFGYSVAISGDTVVVGAPREDSNATTVNGDGTNNSSTDSGAAYVFVRAGGAWTYQAYLKPLNTGAGDLFGGSVSVSGDTVVAGASKEDSSNIGVNGASNESADGAGAAYVFLRTTGAWSQQAYLKPLNTGAGDDFGNSVGMFGDTVVVGAGLEDSSNVGVNGASNESADGAGAAYIFVRVGGTWSQQAYLKASNTAAGDQFGWSVSVWGDTVAVGAPSQAFQSGAVYVFVRVGAFWTQQAFLKASNPGSFDSFGWSVGVATDAVVVGAPNEDSNATVVNGDGTNNSSLEAGAAYLFVRTGGVWSQREYLKPTNTGSGDTFGFSVAVSPNLVVTGALAEDSNAIGVNGGNNNTAPEAGAAYVFPLTFPVVVSVAPPVSVGTTQTYTFTFSDPDGRDDLNIMNVLINNDLEARNACYIAYIRSINAVALVNDAGASGGPFAGVMVLNGPGSVSNSQCTITGSATSVGGSGETLTLTLTYTFNASFGGNKLLYLAARDVAEQNSGWQIMGVHGVPPLPAAFPKPISMNPASGSTANATIAFTFQDANTATNLLTEWVLINTSIDARSACYIAYYRPGNLVLLFPDNGNGAQVTSMELTGTNTVSNSQCTVSAQGSSVVVNGAQLIVNLNIAFSSAFAGRKGVWMAASTMSGTNSNWEALGVWRVP